MEKVRIILIWSTLHQNNKPNELGQWNAILEKDFVPINTGLQCIFLIQKPISAKVYFINYVKKVKSDGWLTKAISSIWAKLDMAKMLMCKCEMIWKNSLTIGKTISISSWCFQHSKIVGFFAISSFAIIDKTTSAPFHGCMSLWLKQKGFLFF